MSGSIPVKCPHCKEINHCHYDDFELGYDKAAYNDVDCDHCDEAFGYEVVSENIYLESVWKADEDEEDEDEEESP